MSESPAPATTRIDLEFDTAASRGMPLGDIASSLVSLHDLLRDLATMAADPASVEFREIQVVAIEMGRPLKIRLSLLAISPLAIKAFQEICRDIILFRDRPPVEANIQAALDLVLRADGKNDQLNERETARLHGHIVALQRAEVPLKRVVVRED
jgi:hypothetical protein